MDSPRLSADDNKQINILVLIIFFIVILIIGLLLIYSYGVIFNNNFLNKIITGLTIIFIILTLITSILYVVYRYNFGDNILDNIDIVIKPIMYTALSGIVAMILLFTKDVIAVSKIDFNMNMVMFSISSDSNPSSLSDTPSMFSEKIMSRKNTPGILLESPQEQAALKALKALTTSNKYTSSTSQVDIIMSQSPSATSSFNI